MKKQNLKNMLRSWEKKFSNNIQKNSDYYVSGFLALVAGSVFTVFAVVSSSTEVQADVTSYEDEGYYGTDYYGGTSFWDVTPEDPYYDAVVHAEQMGIFDGYPDGTMKPAAVVNKAEMLKVFLEGAAVPLEECTYDLYDDVKAGDWFCKYVKFATDNGILREEYDGYYHPELPMTRGRVADLFYMYDVFYLGMQ